MADSRDLVGWAQDTWRVVDRTVGETIRDSAVLRNVVPAGPVMDGKDTVPFPVEDENDPGRIVPGQTLVPVILNSEFRIEPEQNRDEGTIVRLAANAAERLARAEDAVILFGENARPLLAARNVDARNLDEKEGLLPNRAGPQVAANQVRQGVDTAIEWLAQNGAGDRYRSVLSTSLFSATHDPIGAGGRILLDQIRNRLDSRYQQREQPFDQRVVESGLLAGRRGVIFRVIGQPIDLVFTMAPRVVYSGHDNRTVLLGVEERFVLRVMGRRAVRQIRV